MDEPITISNVVPLVHEGCDVFVSFPGPCKITFRGVQSQARGFDEQPMNPYQSPQTVSKLKKTPVEPPVIFAQFVLHGVAAFFAIIVVAVLHALGHLPDGCLFAFVLLNHLAMSAHGLVAVYRWNRR